MEPLLSNLYSEYQKLLETFTNTKDRLDKVSALIKAYGGDVPNSDELHKSTNDVANMMQDLRGSIYPRTGTWSDKVLFALKYFNKPATSPQILEYIVKHEPSVNQLPNNLQNLVAATCSKLSKEGTIGVDDSEFRHKYFLKE